MAGKDIYDFARALMKDEEFNMGGIPRNERKWLDAVGFEYTVKDGCIYGGGEDMETFYRAMADLMHLQRKYHKEVK